MDRKCAKYNMMIFIINILNLILFIFLCNSGFEKKEKSNLERIVGFVLLCIISCFSVLFSKLYLPVLIRLLALCCYSLYFFKINFLDSIFVTFSLDINVGIAEFFASGICIAFSGGEINLSVGSDLYKKALILSAILSAILTIVFSYLLKRLKNIGNINVSYQWTLLILPVTTFFLIMNISDYLVTVEKSFLYILNIALLLVANYVTLWLYIRLFESLKRMDELQFINQNIQLQNEKYELIADNYDKSFVFLHDLLHQCVELEQFENYDSQHAKELLSNISNKIARKFNSFYTESYPLKIVLNQYNEMLLDNGIAFNSQILEFPSFVTKADQTFLFENLLKVSIESCKEIEEEKYINIQTKNQRNGVIIHFTFGAKINKVIDLGYLKSNYHVIQKSELVDGVQKETIFIGKLNKY
ncbi:MAG: hypothetical protein Q4C49_02880 [Bacillota bacterium]|nr:hypothetical protein [Bacillota bacterium]